MYTIHASFRRMLVILPLALLFILSACEVQKPQMTDIRNVSFVSIKKKVLTLEMEPVVTNPNPIPFSVENVKADILLDGRKIGESESNETFTIEAGTDTQFPIQLRIETKNIRREIMKTLVKDSVSLVIDGTYQFKGEALNFDLPYRHETFVKPKEELKSLLTKLF